MLMGQRMKTNLSVFYFAVLSLFMGMESWAQGTSFESNALSISNAPSWAKASRMQKIVDRVQGKLEWDIRKIRVIFHTDEGQFLKEFGVPGASISAFARKSDMSVHIGPSVDTQKFDGVFAHELSHVISYQKYKDAIPKWLEEGLANLVAKRQKPDYAWLASQTLPQVRSMGHPFRATTAGSGASDSVRLHYEASHALAELLSVRCGLHDLLQLSTGSSVEKYIATLCGIPDLDAALAKWVKRKSPPK